MVSFIQHGLSEPVVEILYEECIVVITYFAFESADVVQGDGVITIIAHDVIYRVARNRHFVVVSLKQIAGCDREHI